MSESLKKALRADIAYHDAAMMTTPHLSRIRNAEVALLALLEEKAHPAAAGEIEAFRRSMVIDEMDGPRRPLADPSLVRRNLVPFRDTLTLVDVLDGKGPL